MFLVSLAVVGSVSNEAEKRDRSGLWRSQELWEEFEMWPVLVIIIPMLEKMCSNDQRNRMESFKINIYVFHEFLIDEADTLTCGETVTDYL